MVPGTGAQFLDNWGSLVSEGDVETYCLFILERGEGREKERERNIDVREKH